MVTELIKTSLNFLSVNFDFVEYCILYLDVPDTFFHTTFALSVLTFLALFMVVCPGVFIVGVLVGVTDEVGVGVGDALDVAEGGTVGILGPDMVGVGDALALIFGVKEADPDGVGVTKLPVDVGVGVTTSLE